MTKSRCEQLSILIAFLVACILAVIIFLLIEYTAAVSSPWIFAAGFAVAFTKDAIVFVLSPRLQKRRVHKILRITCDHFRSRSDSYVPVEQIVEAIKEMKDLAQDDSAQVDKYQELLQLISSAEQHNYRRFSDFFPADADRISLLLHNIVRK